MHDKLGFGQNVIFFHLSDWRIFPPKTPEIWKLEMGGDKQKKMVFGKGIQTRSRLSR